MNSAARRGRNEALFREVNDRIADMSTTSDLVDFICECSDKACLHTFTVDMEMYRHVREHDRRFLVTPGHVDHEVEAVVGTWSDFVIVEKVGVAGVVAEAIGAEPLEA